MDTAVSSSRWSAAADAYDAWFDRPWGRHATAVEHRLLLDAAGPVSGRVVLDAGCGTGRFMHRLEAEGATVIGVDRDPDALDIARTSTTGALLLGDTHQLPLPDRSVDVTFAVTVCEFTAEPARVFAERARVTRPGGRIVVGSLNPTSPWGCWNQRQFTKPPWSTARFLDRRSLIGLGAAHGRCDLSVGLYAPAVLPGIEWWSPVLEHIGRRAVPWLGAFQVLTIQLPATRPDSIAAGPQT
jgi:ubiquinone/menaquinone biosynthesis C-methylase UbiE